METQEFNKKLTFKNNGFLHILVNLLLLVGSIVLTIVVAGLSIVTDANGEPTAFLLLPLLVGCILFFVYIMHCVGFMIIQPNQSRVLTFFGRYAGTVRQNGFFWVNPFYAKRKISLRARNMDVPPIKVNDRNGNPIMIGLVLVWKVSDTYKAVFNIDVDTLTSESQSADKQGQSNQQLLKGYDSFVHVQSDAALRKVAGHYAYDNMERDSDEITLRSGADEINLKLEEELRSRLSIAGIEVIEARINYLAYAAEIASVMLRRQQADAIISAREKIVEGAVSMVELALNKLNERNVVQLDEERKAAMVSNLLVVLCADESASPVLNTGSIY